MNDNNDRHVAEVGDYIQRLAVELWNGRDSIVPEMIRVNTWNGELLVSITGEIKYSYSGEVHDSFDSLRRYQYPT